MVRLNAPLKVGRLKLTGFTGWAFWGIAHVYFLVGLRYRIAVAFKWLWDYLTLQRGARLITGTEEDGPVGQAPVDQAVVPSAAEAKEAGRG